MLEESYAAMAKEVGILFYRNMIEHCKAETHFIKTILDRK